MTVNYTITALEIGVVDAFPADFAFDGFLYPGEFFRSSFKMTLIRGGGHTILVDTGYDLSDAVKRGMLAASFGRNGLSPAEALGAAGVSPEEVDTIILSHLHWDHAGAMDCYPNARFYLQKKEYEQWKRLTAEPGSRALYEGILDPADLVRVEGLLRAGRMELLEGEVDDLLPGIHIRVSEFAHSFALQIPLVETGGKRYVIATDAYIRPENLLGSAEMPCFLPAKKFGIGSPVHMVKTYADMLSWCEGDMTRIISAHDGTAKDRLPSREIAPELYAIFLA